MHVFFSGIGGAAIGPLALIARQAGYEVSGSDAKDTSYIADLGSKGITNIQIGQTTEQIAKLHSQKPIDWLVYSSALPRDNPNHPELEFCRQNGIKTTKRDDFLNKIIKDKDLKLIAVAGTHGKTTTTAMAVWLFKQLEIPLSYSLGAKLSFGEMGQFDPAGRYFVYEADEFDRNFLSFYPEVSLISGIDWDHPDIYPTREGYYEAFVEFIEQSNLTYLWRGDAEKLALDAGPSLKILDDKDPQVDTKLKLPGHVNRLDAWLAAQALQPVLGQPVQELAAKLNQFLGLSRRFEALAPNLYTDYAHTPPKIRGALQLAREVAHSTSSGQAGDKVVVVYEGLHNTRQHFIKDELVSLFDDVKQLYIAPSYLAREDKDLELLTPEKLLDLLSNSAKDHAQPARLNDELKAAIQKHLSAGDLVLCLSAGGAGSLDEWLRKEFAQ
jgi:UDP-N-acetylmuramate--alanine ligase